MSHNLVLSRLDKSLLRRTVKINGVASGDVSRCGERLWDGSVALGRMFIMFLITPQGICGAWGAPRGVAEVPAKWSLLLPNSLNVWVETRS